MQREQLIQFAIKMELEGRGYFFESYVGRSELESLPSGLREVCLQIQEGLQQLDAEFIKLGVDPEEYEV